MPKSNHLEIDPSNLPKINKEPFAFRHDLGDHALFELDRLARLGDSMDPGDFFVSVPARGVDAEFYGEEQARPDVRVSQVLGEIENGRYKVLLKRPENYDEAYRVLLDELLAQMFEATGTRARDVLRAESGVFITGCRAITPYHFDPELAFFMQIKGPKEYHVFSPQATTDAERELYYQRDYTDVGRVTMRTASKPYELEVQLEPGIGLHQPSEGPHWVRTIDSVSVSYAVGIETRQTRSTGRTHAYNHFARKAGLSPIPYGDNPRVDRFKSAAMRVGFPAVNLLRHLRSLIRGGFSE